MEKDAQAYDELNQPQTKIGCQFIRKLNLSQGDKVLDMGCGTGTVTKYISDVVGPDGQVVGIDPDAARIKIAQEKYQEIRSHLQFQVGSSVTGFPHDNEPYYDAHISTAAFDWVPIDEKKIYIQKAYQCLKSGGKLAILCVKAFNNVPMPNVCPLTQDGHQKIFQEVGLFPNVVVERAPLVLKLKSFEEFKRWWKASTHRDFDEMNQAFVQEMMQDLMTIGDDGVVTLSVPGLHITATKI